MIVKGYWMRLCKLFIVFFCFSLSACTHVQPKQKVVASPPDDSSITRLAKSDIDEVVEFHQHTVIKHLKSLMIKLYKRNPSSRHDKEQRSVEESVSLVFSKPHNTRYPQFKNLTSTDLIHLALDPDYQGAIAFYRLLLACVVC